MENPEAYLSIVNEALDKQGIPPVFVSAKNLSDSRKLYNNYISAKLLIPQPPITSQYTPTNPSLSNSQSCRSTPLNTPTPSVPIPNRNLPQPQSREPTSSNTPPPSIPISKVLSTLTKPPHPHHHHKLTSSNTHPSPIPTSKALSTLQSHSTESYQPPIYGPHQAISTTITLNFPFTSKSPSPLSGPPSSSGTFMQNTNFVLFYMLINNPSLLSSPSHQLNQLIQLFSHTHPNPIYI